jgi:hypothetical protein
MTDGPGKRFCSFKHRKFNGKRYLFIYLFFSSRWIKG